MKARHKRARRQRRRVNRAKMDRWVETMAHFRETPADVVVSYDEMVAWAAMKGRKAT